MGKGLSKDKKVVCALIEGGMAEDCDSCYLKEICAGIDDAAKENKK